MQEGDAAGPRVPWWRGQARGFAVASALLLGLGTAAGFLGGYWWVLGLAAHLKAHLALACLAALLPAALGRARLAGLVLAVLAAVNLVPLLPWLAAMAEPRAVAGAPEQRLRLMILNLRGPAVAPDRLAVLLDEARPDIVFLSEVPRPGPALREMLEARYPHLADHDRLGPGLLLAGTWRPEAARVDKSAGGDHPVAALRLCPPAGECLEAVGLHAASPLEDRGRPQAVQLEAVMRLAAAAGPRRLVMGDLNLTPWSPGFPELLAGAGLADSSLARGLSPSWRHPWGLPIDHVLVGPGLAVLDNRLGPDVGSDHRPVIVDLALAPPS